MTEPVKTFKKYHILIVDDEDVVLEATKKYLKTCYDYSADTAISGPVALEMLSQTRYDAIIADFDMKGMTGLELLKNIRSRGNSIPFIIFTGKGREEVVIAAYDYGADGYVQKGGEIKSQFAELAHRIQTSIEKKRSIQFLQESEEKFRQLFNNASDAIYLHGFSDDQKPGKFIEVNNAACLRMGYTHEEFLQLGVSELNSAESNEIIPQIVQSLCEHGHTRFECTHITKDRKIIPVEIASHLFSLNNQTVVLSICRDISERKHAEKEKDAILTGLKDIIVEYVDKDMNIIWANQAMRDAFQVKGTITGETCYRITQGRTSPCPGCTAQKAIETGEFQEGEVSTPDGRHWLVRSNPVIEEGKVTNVVHVAINITDRKNAETALSRSEQQLADIINFLPDPTIVVDKNGTIISWNYAIEQMSGIPATDMLGKENYEHAIPFYGKRRPILIDYVMHPDESILHHYPDVLRDGNKIMSESIIANFKGKNVTLWCIAAPLYDRSGRLIGAIESIRDITERKRIEDALHETVETLKTVMDSTDALVYVSDMQTHEVLFINQYGRNVWGNIVGKKCYESIQKDQKTPCSFCTNSHLLDTQGNPTGTVIWEFQNTLTRRWYHCHDCAVKWIDGRIVRLEIATDITKQKNEENALISANRQLNMLSGITRHDIRNTINAMQIFIELIKKKIEIAPAYKEFENLEKAITQIQSQIEFTTIYKDIGTHAPIWQNLYQLISQISHQYSISLDFKGDNIEIYADPLLMKVFENLVENAIRHGQTVSKIEIYYKVHQNDMTLFFEDDGIGIPDQEKELIFDRGYGKNTGLGLFFIREILTLTEITTSETGKYGEGARFEFFIPEGKWRISKKL